MDEQDVDLRGIAEQGFIRFSIKDKDTPQNAAVHAAFKEFCAVECDNSYTRGLRKLLEAYEHDAHFEALWERLSQLEQQFAEFKKIHEKPSKKDDEEDEGMF